MLQLPNPCIRFPLFRSLNPGICKRLNAVSAYSRLSKPRLHLSVIDALRHIPPAIFIFKKEITYMKILFTGFDPFGGETVNPAYEAVKLLPDEIAGAKITKLEVPTVFTRSCEVLRQNVEALRPDAVICVGQAGGRAAITPEKVAINLMDGRIPDNDGFQPVDTSICPGGPDAYFSSLPVRAIAENIRFAGIPAGVSYTAGTYVCNCLMYSLLQLISCEYPHMLGGFIHVPYSMEQAAAKSLGTPGMDIHQIARGLTIAAETVAAACSSQRSGQHIV